MTKHKHKWNGSPADESRGKPFYYYCDCGDTRRAKPRSEGKMGGKK